VQERYDIPSSLPNESKQRRYLPVVAIFSLFSLIEFTALSDKSFSKFTPGFLSEAAQLEGIPLVVAP